MIGDRATQLLKLAAAQLDDGMNPFTDTFLRENEVTSDECMDMADHTALAIRCFVKLCENHARDPVFTLLLAEVIAEEVTDDQATD